MRLVHRTGSERSASLSSSWFRVVAVAESVLFLALVLKMGGFLKTRNIYLSCELMPSGISE